MLNFSMMELIHSDKAKANNIDNVPKDVKVYDNLLKLIYNVLQPLRDDLKAPIIVSSGYRCLKLNRLLKSKDTSEHVLGMAADINVKGLTPWQVYKYIINSKLKFHQCILEYNSWVHISYNEACNTREHFRID